MLVCTIISESNDHFMRQVYDIMTEKLANLQARVRIMDAKRLFHRFFLSFLFTLFTKFTISNNGIVAKLNIISSLFV